MQTVQDHSSTTERAAVLSESRKSVSLRGPWPWAGVLIGLPLVLTSAAVIWTGEPLDAVLVTSMFMGVPGLALCLRAPFMRVVVSASGVTYHGFFRNQHYAKSVMDSALVVEVGSTLGSAYAPGVLLRSGDIVTLGCLAGYSTPNAISRSRMRKQSVEIAEFCGLPVQRGEADSSAGDT